MSKRIEWFRAVGVVSVLASGCDSSSQDCSTEDMPAVSGQVIYVSQSCGSSSGDGSRSKPYATIGGATQKAAAGSTIAVGAGVYAETVQLPGGVSLRGVGRTQVVIAPTSGYGIVADVAGDATLTSLMVRGATGVGVQIKQAQLDVIDVEVRETKLGPGVKPGGHGVQAQEAAKLTLKSCRVMDNAGVGVFAEGVGTVQIIDPVFSQSPISAAGNAAIVDPVFSPNPGSAATDAAIIDPVFSPASVIGGNGGGGVAIIDPVFSPQAASVPSLLMMATNVSGNTGFGVALYGGSAGLFKSAIHGTKSSSSGGVADGLLVALGSKVVAAAKPLPVEVGADTVIGNNLRAGVLATASTEVQLRGQVAANGFGGVWAQGGGARVNVRPEAVVAVNRVVGVAASAGASLDVDGARILRTREGTFAPVGGGLPAKVGDGLAVYNQARARVRGAQFVDNFRAGLIVDGADTEKASDKAQAVMMVQVEGAKFSGGEYGIAVNKGTSGAIPPAGLDKGNEFKEVKKPVDTASNLPAPVVMCAVDASGRSACDDGNPCTTDTCNESQGCVHVPTAKAQACDDGNPCTTADACADGLCRGTGPACDDGNPCTFDTCEGTDTCRHQSREGSCKDGNPCTVWDECKNDTCSGEPRVCDDGNPATLDSCDPVTASCVSKQAP